MTEPTKLFLKARGARLIVKEDDFEYKGTIVIPENAKRRTSTGHIVDVGREAEEEGFEVGQRVLYSQFSGTGVNFRNRPAYRIISVEEVLAIVTAEDEQLESTVA